ncbi:MAG: FAD-binding oxidoreductase [Novosphingobium sp.]|nr:FAD-binding oxidoreductase [Novosphingobium sp.]
MADRIALPEPRDTPYGRLRAAPFHGDAELPREVDVAIIGGGINGVIAAWILAGRGLRVLLCEKAELACEASSRAFGWISELLLDPIKMPLNLESKRLWAQLQAEVGETGYRRNGLAYLAASQDELDFYAGWLDSVKGIGSECTRILTAGETRDRFPDARTAWAGAILAPSDGGTEPQLSTVAVARAARERGAAIVTGCAVRTLDIAGGQVCGIHTERGSVRAAKVLFAGNAWSRLFLGNHGVDIPQLMITMSAGRTQPDLAGPVGCGGVDAWAWRQQVDGGYSLGRLRGQRVPLTRDCIQLFSRFVPLIRAEWANVSVHMGRDARADWRRARRWSAGEISPMERERVLNPIIDRSVSDTSMALNAREFPGMTGTVHEYWSGVLTATPDNMPIASAVAKLPGLYLITGCSYGLTWAPALAGIVADLMTGHTPSLDPHPYRLERFFDGSPLRLTH